MSKLLSRIFFILFSLLLSSYLIAQQANNDIIALNDEGEAIATEDTTILSFSQFIEMVITYHPVARQAQLRPAMADAQMLGARGNFDPKIATDWSEKDFDAKDYYRIIEGGFKIPTWYGLTLSGGYQNNDGMFLNPENTTDDFGLWHLGVEMNVLQGLIIDERRASIQQARIFEKATENEQELMLNNLLVDAAHAYLHWQSVYEAIFIIEESIELAQQTYDATVLSVVNGDKAPIDTVEALLIVQDRQYFLQESLLQLIDAVQAVENFLWFDGIPIEVGDNMFPEPLALINFGDLMALDNNDEMFINTHPEILEKMLKQESFGIDLRLKKDKLKPKLKVKYNPLLATTENDAIPTYSVADLKWGFSFSFPLFLRSERAAIQKVNLKIKENQFDIEDKRNNISNKIAAFREKNIIVNNQLDLQALKVDGSRRLLEGELERLSYGESSIFLINKREQKYLDEQIKQISLLAKFNLTGISLLFFQGQLFEQYELLSY